MAEARLDPGLLIPIPFPCTAPALPLRDHSAGWAVLNIRLLLIDNFFFFMKTRITRRWEPEEVIKKGPPRQRALK